MKLDGLPKRIIEYISSFICSDKTNINLCLVSKKLYIKHCKFIIHNFVNLDDLILYKLYDRVCNVRYSSVHIIFNLCSLQYVHTIKFPYNFNQPINKDNLPPLVQTLIFGDSFNKPVDNLPTSVHTLTFGWMFDQPIDNLPASVQTLIFGYRFNQPVDNLPASVQTLTFGFWFNQLVDHLPSSLTTLTFGLCFNQ